MPLLKSLADPRGLSGKVQTVLGLVEPGDLGVTLPHEHLLIDLRCYLELPTEASQWAYVNVPLSVEMLGRLPEIWNKNLDNLILSDVELAIRELSLFKQTGGDSLVDTTSANIGRDPLALARIARATGVHVIMGAGYYVPKSHPPDMDTRSEESIAGEMIRDVIRGVGETHIRAGIIGEIGCAWPLGANEIKVLRAAGHAHRETGVPITIHPGLNEQAPFAIMDVLDSAGVAARHVTMGHLGPRIEDLAVLKDFAARGCFLGYDNFGFEDSGYDFPYTTGKRVTRVSDVQRLDRIQFLVEQGFLTQVLISQDISQKWQLTRYGGKGYAHVLNSILPRMRRRGFTETQLETIFVDNPARSVTFR